MLDTRNHSPVQRQFDAGFLAVEADLRNKVRDAGIPAYEREFFFRVIDRARDAILTEDHVWHCGALAKTWEREAYKRAEPQYAPSYCAAEALEMAVLYETFAKALAPYAKRVEP